MVTLRMENGKLIGIDDEFVPVPHSLTRIIHKSGNYGLADRARADFQHLVLKPGEVPGPVRRMGMGGGQEREETSPPRTSIGRGRGRGRLLKPAPPSVSGKESDAASGITNSSCSQSGTRSGSVFRDNRLPGNLSAGGVPLGRKGETKDGPTFQQMQGIFMTGIEDKEEEPGQRKKESIPYHAVEGPEPGDDNIQLSITQDPLGSLRKLAKNAGTGGGAMGGGGGSGGAYGGGGGAYGGGGGGGKTNGYCLFMRYMARKTGTTGSISELMRIFDHDWKMLPEEEKKDWKLRAKTGGRFPDSGGKRGGGVAGATYRDRKPSLSSQTSGTSASAQQHTATEESDEGY